MKLKELHAFQDLHTEYNHHLKYVITVINWSSH